MLAQTISRVRRNHGLEHATIHVLSEKHKNFSAQGNSDHRGFHLNIYGSIPEEAIIHAVEEAYQRMIAGEKELAVHPNSGPVLLPTPAMRSPNQQHPQNPTTAHYPSLPTPAHPRQQKPAHRRLRNTNSRLTIHN